MARHGRRFTEHFKTGKPLELARDHPAVLERRTMFPTRVSEPEGTVLKAGKHQRKIGDRVVKGRWAGMQIFTLTLEERATCPRSCHHWQDCYGNHMHFPKRWKHGEALEFQLEEDLLALADKYPDGFVVRLHILGDFYSVEYVRRWERWMFTYPGLHVFGYSAWWISSPIGAALSRVRELFPDRWWVRWSHHDKDTWLSTGESGIICPVQTGKTDCCATCGLCWTAKAPIRFLRH